MAAPTEDGLREALRAVRDPRSGQDIVAAGLIDSLQAKGSLVQLTLRAERAQLQAMEAVRREAERCWRASPG